MPPPPALVEAQSSDSLSEELQKRSLIILDWDDTCLASTWLAANNLRLDSECVPSHLQEELQELETRLLRFLERAMQLGQVVIITNAERGWIELSACKFLPNVADILCNVKVVSARSQFEGLFPNHPGQWKVQAFREEILGMANRLGHINVISIGDSNHEREALHVVTQQLDTALVKSVKFVERPGMDVLRRQIELLHGCIEYIAQYSSDLDLMLSQALLLGSDKPTTSSSDDMDREVDPVKM